MPQIDIGAVVTACAVRANDRKISFETHAAADSPKAESAHPAAAAAAAAAVGRSIELPSDFPPESFLLSEDAEYDWLDRNTFYERKGSTRSYSNSGNLNPPASAYPTSNSNSQRFPANCKSKASIIGLPKTQKTTFGDAKRRVCKPGNICLLPKRSESMGKSANPVEPDSPKVSCMGRVRSRRCRRSRTSSSRKKGEKRGDKSRTGCAQPKTGLYSKVIGMFRSNKAQGKQFCRRKVGEVIMEPPDSSDQMRRSRSVKVEEMVVAGEDPVVEAPALGKLIRFESGRRSDYFNRRV